MLNFIETRDWKSAFFKAIPRRKRDNAEGETLGEEKVATQDAADVVAVTKEDEKEDLEGVIEEGSVSKKQCIRETKDGVEVV